MRCSLPPYGWVCTRDAGHDGPCAAWPVQRERRKLAAYLLLVGVVLFIIVFVLAINGHAQTVQEELQDHVSAVPVSDFFPGYYGVLTVNSKHAAEVTILAEPDECGRMFYDQVAYVEHEISDGVPIASIDIRAPNDGVDACGHLTLALDGKVLRINRGGAAVLSISHYEVFASTDGVHLSVLFTLAASATECDFTYRRLPRNVQLYVKAVGRPLYRNMFAGPVVLH